VGPAVLELKLRLSARPRGARIHIAFLPGQFVSAGSKMDLPQFWCNRVPKQY